MTAGQNQQLAATPKQAPKALSFQWLLAGLLGPYLGRLAAACLLAIIAGLMDIAVFVLLWFLIEEAVAQDPDTIKLLTYAVCMPIAAIIRFLMIGGSAMVSHAIAFRIARELRSRLLNCLNRQYLGRVEGRTAALKKAIIDYPSEVEHFVAHTIPDAVAGLTSLVAGATILCVVDWRMALFALALLPITAVAQFAGYKALGDSVKSWFAADKAATAALISYVRCIATLKSFNRTASSMQDLRGSVDSLLDTGRRAVRDSAIPFAIFFTTVAGSLMFVAPAGLYFLSTGAITLGEFVLFITLGAQVAAPMMRLLFANGAMQRLDIAIKQMGALLTAPQIAYSDASKAPGTGGVRFDSVSFSYDAGKDILQKVTLSIPDGKVTAIVGPSGAGKTTLLRLIARFWDVTSGSVLIGGIDVREIAEERFQSLVSVVFQDPYFFFGTIRENLAIAAPCLTDDDIKSACAAVGLDTFLNDLPEGLDTSIGDRGMRLSGGEKQRLAIARALLKDAPILLLDEATAFSDPENELSIQRALAKLTVGRTVIVVAHRLATTQSADLIVVLKDGAVEATGEHGDLVQRSPTYAELWRSQQLAFDWHIGQAETVSA